jgi:hypothetical protein
VPPRAGFRRPVRALAGALAAVALAALPAGGCVGYVMGWSDREVERHRRVIAELEMKNASLVEEVLELRARLRAMESHGGPAGADRGAGPAAGADAGR